MAEQFAKAWLAQKSLEYRVISRALTDRYEPPNSRASSHSVQILAEDFSLDLRSHRSALLTAAEVEDAQLIIGVTESHVQTIKQRFPAATGKVYSFGSDVPDPWHASIGVYRDCARKMEPLVHNVLDRHLDHLIVINK